MADANPTFRRRELGLRLRELRLQAAMTVEDVAARLLCSPSKISRQETGQRATSLRDVRDLCAIYGVSDPAEQDHLMSLARDAQQRGWWQEYDDLGNRRDYTYIGLEDQAARISIYHPSSVPALLQTEDYAGALIRGMLPRINDNALSERVEARLSRQSNTFNFLEFDDPSIPDVVYVEGLVGNIYAERESDLARYREALHILASAALSPEASLDSIRQIGNEFAQRVLDLQ